MTHAHETEMFRAISVSRFRGFKKLNIRGLDRFNLFLGRNNVGKTALLEAIFLLAGPTNPDLPLRLSAFRGIDQLRTIPEELWGWLFFEKDLKQDIALELHREAHAMRTLRMQLSQRTILQKPRKGKSGPPVRSASTSTATTPTELKLVFQDENRRKVETRIFIAEDGSLRFERESLMHFPQSVFVIARGAYSPENAERFSKLEEVGKQDDVLPALQSIEPRLKRLSILVTAAGPVIHGDVGIGRMLPVPMMGDGVGRLLTLLLAIAASPGGFVLVDEIETGLHYSVMADVWTSIASLARQLDVQLFATTHSWECLRAAHEAFAKSEIYDFRMHRLDRVEGDVTVTTYDQAMIDTALSSGLEIR